MKPIVLIHGYSSEGRDREVEQIYGSLPADLKKEFGAATVLDINLSRWISIDDGVALNDISFALERALNHRTYRGLLRTGFHVVIHSTGALVVRNWIRLFERKPSPIGNLVYLAGANFGSGLAHVAKGQAIRWSRLIFQGSEGGVRVLNELEFGSSRTLDLNLHFRKAGHRMWDDYEVQEFCLNGSQTLDSLRLVPIRYVKEDSSDNTVRTSSCNLNFNYISVSPKPGARSIKLKIVESETNLRLNDAPSKEQWYEYDISRLADQTRQVPFAILYQTAHFGEKRGIVSGTSTRREVLPLLKEALTTPYDEAAYETVVTNWHNHTRRTFARVEKLKGRWTEWNPQAQYEGHSQLIFRLRDQFGEDVVDHDIMFKSRGTRKQTRLEKMIEDKHVNRANPGTTTYYLRTMEFDKNQTGDRRWKNRLDSIATLHVEVSGSERQSGEISYLPLTIELPPTLLRKFLQPFRTTLIDITLLRLPSDKVFALSPSK